MIGKNHPMYKWKTLADNYGPINCSYESDSVEISYQTKIASHKDTYTGYKIKQDNITLVDVNSCNNTTQAKNCICL